MMIKTQEQKHKLFGFSKIALIVSIAVVILTCITGGFFYFKNQEIGPLLLITNLFSKQPSSEDSPSEQPSEKQSPAVPADFVLSKSLIAKNGVSHNI